MEIVDDATRRTLAYLDAVNRFGVMPDKNLVDEFATRPRQLSPIDRVVLGASFRTESFSEYAERLGWVRIQQDAVELTDLGQGLVRAFNAPTIGGDEAEIVEIVLDPKDPFAYAMAIRGLASAPSALLVEPYFRLEQLRIVNELSNITRVLMMALSDDELKEVAFGLGVLPDSRTLEVRLASREDMHDRYLIPASGQVLMFGTSMGTIGRKWSTQTSLGEVASTAIRKAYEDIWRSSKRLEPISPKPE